MKKVKKAIRLLAYVLLIVLACIGVGLSGGIPEPFSQKRREQERTPIEMLDEDINEKEEEDFKL